MDLSPEAATRIALVVMDWLADDNRTKSQAAQKIMRESGVWTPVSIPAKKTAPVA